MRLSTIFVILVLIAAVFVIYKKKSATVVETKPPLTDAQKSAQVEGIANAYIDIVNARTNGFGNTMGAASNLIYNTYTTAIKNGVSYDDAIALIKAIK